MIAIDTNIIVRLITKDDELQYQQSLELFKNKKFYKLLNGMKKEWILPMVFI